MSQNKLRDIYKNPKSPSKKNVHFTFKEVFVDDTPGMIS